MRLDHTASVSAEVRAEMARQGVSQTALARRLGWLQNRLSRRLTAGKTAVPFTVAELLAVAAALGVPVAQFLPPEAGETTHPGGGAGTGPSGPGGTRPTGPPPPKGATEEAAA